MNNKTSTKTSLFSLKQPSLESKFVPSGMKEKSFVHARMDKNPQFWGRFVGEWIYVGKGL